MMTIREVAEHAGVSVKTVSRVLGGGRGVGAKTMAHVEQVMSELDYHPSAAARSLRGHGAGAIALIADQLTMTPDAFAIVRGVQSACNAAGKLLMIGEAAGQVSTLEQLYVEFRRQRAEAIILATMRYRAIELPERLAHGNLILVNCFDPLGRFPAFLPDDEGGAYAATHRLLELGHRRIAYLGLDGTLSSHLARRAGYLDALRSFDAPVDPRLIRSGGRDDADEAFDALPDLLDMLMGLDSPPTALLCGDDKMAMRVFNVLHARGFKVPHDISVVGYDDYRLISENLIPRLTSVSLPYDAMGRGAVEAAVTGHASGITRVACPLIERESTRRVSYMPLL